MSEAIYSRPRSLYARLLAMAGCEAGDFQALLEREGVEDALEALQRRGVYLTGDEFKGRCPVVRGSTTLAGGPGEIRNPLARFHLPLHSSGSRGRGTPVLIDLAYVRDCGVSTGAALAAWDAAGAENATWEVPGGGSLFRLLEFAAFAGPPARWFTPLRPDAAELHPRYRWSAAALRWGGRLARVELPAPLYTPLDDASAIVEWIEETLAAGRVPLLFCMASAALRVAETAAARGADVAGAWVIAAGEPLTAARLGALRRQGLRVICRYGAIESGPIGYGCPAARQADEMHLLTDLHALIQVAPEDGDGLPAGAFLLTSLRATAPFVFLNVSLGDAGVVDCRPCGCALAELGWTTRLHTIRSFEKLTVAGANFSDSQLIGVLEEVMPARFGGGPADYQLIEEETPDGRPGLRLRIHPRVGRVESQAARAAFLDALGAGSGAERVMSLVWRDAGLPEVERAPPHTTRTGKLLHIHRVS